MDSRTWDKYEEAIRNLKAKLNKLKEDKASHPPYKLSRSEASRICGMSPSVFGREVPMSSLFRAYYREPEYTGRACYYNIEDLIHHFERISQRSENVRLLCELYCHGVEWFEKQYNEPEFVFAEDTYLPIGDFNPAFAFTENVINNFDKSNLTEYVLEENKLH